MKSPILESIHEKLLYNEEMSPDENVNRFFEATKILRYEWMVIEVEKIKQHYLVSAWENEVVLREMTMTFRSAFANALVAKSMDGRSDLEYGDLLAKCKEAVRKARHYFNISFTDILILTRPADLTEAPLIVNFESLSDKHRLSITRCYDLIVVFFKELSECIEEEIKEFERSEYVRNKSTYIWSGDKNELSELGMALFASGKISRRDGKKIRASTLARELAAICGIDSLDYDQNLMAMTYRTHGSKTEFLDDLKKKAEAYYKKRIEDQC